jgi:hypothetical protein
MLKRTTVLLLACAADDNGSGGGRRADTRRAAWSPRLARKQITLHQWDVACCVRQHKGRLQG